MGLIGSEMTTTLKGSDVTALPRRDDKSLVRSLAKGLRILEAFNKRQADGAEMTLTEIARAAGLDAGTAYRLVRTLQELDYVEKIDGTKRFRLTFKVIDLGFNAFGRMDVRDLVRPGLRRLVGEVNEAASFGVLDGTDVVYVERVQAGLVRLGANIRIGSRIPTYYTAIGHSILAFLDEEQCDDILSRQTITKISETTPRSVEEIKQQLKVVRDRGWALSEPVPGLRVLAAPILDPDQHPYGAISVAAPSANSSREVFLNRTLEPLIDSAQKLGVAISISGATTS